MSQQPGTLDRTMPDNARLQLQTGRRYRILVPATRTVLVRDQPAHGAPYPFIPYVLRFADGSERQGFTDEDGIGCEEECPWAAYELSFPEGTYDEPASMQWEDEELDELELSLAAWGGPVEEEPGRVVEICHSPPQGAAPYPFIPYLVRFEDPARTERRGFLDEEGCAREEDCPHEDYILSFPEGTYDAPPAMEWEDEELPDIEQLDLWALAGAL